MTARRLSHQRVGAALGCALFTLSTGAFAQSVPPPLTPEESAAFTGKPVTRAPTNAGDAPTAKDAPTRVELAKPSEAAEPKRESVETDAAIGKNKLDAASRGVVILERGGKPISLGMLLAGDGRILTALSPLGHGNNVDARFADGKLSPVRVDRSDRGWDLALVVPQSATVEHGLRASRAALTQDSKASYFSLGGNKKLTLTRITVKGQRALVGGDSQLLGDAIELGTKLKATDVGAPIVDQNGDVVALVARACAPPSDKTCTLAPYGVPVRAIKSFLRARSDVTATTARAWLGIRGVADRIGPVRGVRCVAVHPESPAGRAGLRPNRERSRADLIVAVDGTPTTSPAGLRAAIAQHAVGDTVQLLVFRSGRYRLVRLTLQAGDAAEIRPDPPPRARRPLRLRQPEPRPRGY